MMVGCAVRWIYVMTPKFPWKMADDNNFSRKKINKTVGFFFHWDDSGAGGNDAVVASYTLKNVQKKITHIIYNVL